MRFKRQRRRSKMVSKKRFISGNISDKEGKQPLEKTELAQRIYKAAHLTGTFTLRSGQVSSEYFALIREYWADFRYKVPNDESLSDVQERNITALNTVLYISQ